MLEALLILAIVLSIIGSIHGTNRRLDKLLKELKWTNEMLQSMGRMMETAQRVPPPLPASISLQPHELPPPPPQ